MPRFSKRSCAICGHRIGRFLPYGGGAKAVPALMQVLHVIGSDPDNYECPRCGSNDRERHLLMYLHATGLYALMAGKNILHFAPEKRLSKLIAACKPSRYIKCDLFPQAEDIICIDMLAIDYEDRSFDVVIANHVLEHVDDDFKALAEIWRVLEIGGLAILQTPFSRKLHNTWADPGINDEPSRVEAYGQGDHVRLYGRDIFDRFTSTGLVSFVQEHTDLLADHVPDELGVNADEPFFLFRRVS